MSVSHQRDDIAVLRWAAGGAVSADRPAYHEEVLANALMRHKLVGRFLERVGRDDPPWVRQDFVERLQIEQADISTRFYERLESLKELYALTDGDGTPPILLKGLTTYALTGDKRFVRASRDIDLIASNDQKLIGVLEDIGFERNDDHCRGHEVAALDRGAVKADLHAYFPVLDAPSRVPVDPASEPPGTDIYGFAPFEERRVDYETLFANSMEVTVDGSRIRILSPTVAAFVLAMHSFREFAHEPFPVPFATVRLGDLIEIIVLTRHRLFEEDSFADLVDRFGAGVSMAFVGRLLDAYFDNVPDVLLSAAEEGVRRFPHDLWIDGFVTLGEDLADTDELLIREASAPMQGLVRRVSGGRPPIISSGEWFSAEPKAAAARGYRVLRQGGEMAVRFAVAYRDDVLSVRLVVEDVSRWEVVRVLLNMGDVLHEIEYNPETGELFPSWQRNTALGRRWRPRIGLTADMSGSDVRLTLQLGAGALPDLSPPPSELPLLLGVRGLSSAPAAPTDGETGDGVLVPLQVKRQGL